MTATAVDGDPSFEVTYSPASSGGTLTGEARTRALWSVPLEALEPVVHDEYSNRAARR